MDILQAMHARHSVRAFTGQAIPPSSVQALQEELARSNAESGLDLRLITDEPQAFSCFLAHYGKFSNVRNYIAVIGDKTPLAEERAGYYGERAVLLAQRLGLNTCWVALSFAQGKTKKSLCIGKGKNKKEPLHRKREKTLLPDRNRLRRHAGSTAQEQKFCAGVQRAKSARMVPRGGGGGPACTHGDQSAEIQL